MRVLLAAMAMLAWAGAGRAEPVKVGLILTMSGPSSTFGRHARDGFQLAVKQLQGRLGPEPALVSVIDDGRDPARAGSLTDAFIRRDKPQFLIGPLFSELFPPVLKALDGSGALLISPNAGPAALAGKRCRPDVFVMSQQDEQPIEVMAKFAEERTLKRAIIVATAGEEAETAATAFKRSFKGEVADRLLIDAQTQDFSDAVNRIDLLRPQVVFLHLSGPAGPRFMAQLKTSGASEGLILLGSSGFDEADLPDHGAAAAGVYSAGNWALGLQTPENVAFVAAFEAEYGYRPGAAAMHSYDAAHLIDRALNLTGGNVADKPALTEALRQAEIESPRGKFTFGNNNVPIQDLYLTRVEKRGDGRIVTEVVKQMFAQYGDHYAAECTMK